MRGGRSRDPSRNRHFDRRRHGGGGEEGADAKRQGRANGDALKRRRL